ncbi:MAG: hypothetical protein QCI82_09915 [Candidatus Thermoplasmatota archaeon]|nr:hypothetical protein [Candidatus Thermoplasmatota archaeon]
MDHYASIKAYLEKLDHSLSDIEPRRRKAMVSDIEGHIQERLNMVEAEKDRGSISGDEIKRILDDFGPPEEVASNFKLQEHGRGTKAVHHVSKRGPIIAIVCISIIFLIIAAGVLSFLILGESEQHEADIIPGEGLKEVKIGEDLDKVMEIFGQPDERADLENWIWISYRQGRGIDFLFSNETKRVMEIRINEGFEGSLEGGISIGDDLEKVFLTMGPPLKRIDLSKGEIENHPEGGDRVLYGQHDGSGTIEAYKYIDENRGILFWADPDMTILQIVVTEPR